MMISNELLFIIFLVYIVLALGLALRFGKETLIAYISVQWVLANILVTTQVNLLNVTATAAEPLAVGALLGFSLLQEFYGKAAAHASILTGFFCLLFTSGITTLYTYYTPSSDDLFYAHTAFVFKSTLRITAASAITYLITQYCDYALFTFLRQRYPKSSFIVRSYATLLVVQLLDTFLFSFLGLYGIHSAIWSVMTVSYIIKIITLMASGPFVSFIYHYLSPKHENIHKSHV